MMILITTDERTSSLEVAKCVMRRSTGATFNDIHNKEMTFTFKFFFHCFIRDGEHGRMETPIRLLSNKRQISFLGEISGNRLQKVFKSQSGLVLFNIKWVLGEGFMVYSNRYRVEWDISSMFLASL